ncbi:hypothetical protein [Azospirillum sp. SYSU D00513]|uniref:hypothetical protein n=1 Tax=Azospirillum sp. SYSU D00513 TaxID=2812561 RepID=UPI001A974FAB|nr:hypothetical protein [Azospirillum sp. SYSU D00513]
MLKLQKTVGLLAHFAFEEYGLKLTKKLPSDVVVAERELENGDIIQLLRQTARLGGCYRVIVRPSGNKRPWIGPRTKREDAKESISRIMRMAHPGLA